MKIGIDISQIAYPGTGVTRYLEGLVNAILQYDSKNHWTFFFSSFRNDLDSQLVEKITQKGFSVKKMRIPPTLLSLLWNDLHKTYIDSLLPDLDFFFTSDWTEPPVKNIKKITTVHDLTVMRYPETVDNKILTTQKKRLQWVKKESNLILADSKTTADDLQHFFKIESNKIKVIYPGVDVSQPTQNDIKLTLQKFNLKKPFILSVGKLEPRKNLKRLIEAFRQLNNQTIELVIVGTNGWGDFSNGDASNVTSQLNNIRFLGYVKDPELYALYASCLFFVYPSLWEGFGYPIVEAMKLGAAVATSNTSSMKEIAENAGLLFDPTSVEEIKNALERMINDVSLRKELSKKGQERSKLFTWKKYYHELMNVTSYKLHVT